MSFVKRKALWLFLGYAAAVLLITGCQKMGICYIAQTTEAAPPEDVSRQETELHYFFDKTESMKGFTWQGDDSEYVNALDSIWKAGENIWPDADALFYEYGEINISRLPKANVQREAGLPGFYGQTNPGNRRVVRTSGRQPFGTVGDYIKSIDAEKNRLYVVVTDLYEQNKANNVFTLFFRNAFESGMSGAFFAVDSSFQGTIWNISSIDNDMNIWVNGRSTFFILIAGSGKEVAQYSERLANEFNNKKLSFEDVVFMVQNDEKPAPWIPDATRMAQNERRFKSDETKYALVNLRTPKSNKELKLYEWIEDSEVRGGYRSIPAAAESYRLMTDIGSRYFAGLPIKNVNLDDFDYSVELSVDYSGGSNSKAAPGELSKFAPARSSLFTAAVLSEAGIPAEMKYNRSYPLYFLMEIKNKPLDTGCYRIEYSIVPDAKVPGWVAGRNVATLAELRNANQPGELIKVLNLKTVYEDIVSLYNSLKTRRIYSWSFYIVKQH
jgi:hypothetical protein